ncbi:hypothetical protein L1987_57335 [Smallanthus sonchifolius]|uniref:Uncharacterized protein n=1 Tax=Smallanthus sonchifolius TaxID=185202 RepID=A0ACB9DCZ9_9ASTR|nr:hypothetical protein L1987_57335 [Smallanthus sonchifolius]
MEDLPSLNIHVPLTASSSTPSCFRDGRNLQLDQENKKAIKKRNMPEKMDCGPVVNDNNRAVQAVHHGINLPVKQLETHLDEFLTADEKRMVDGSKEGIEVRVVDDESTANHVDLIGTRNFIIFVPNSAGLLNRKNGFCFNI